MRWSMIRWERWIRRTIPEPIRKKRPQRQVRALAATKPETKHPGWRQIGRSSRNGWVFRWWYFGYSGELAEWLMASVLKTDVPERVSGVRIPRSPPRPFKPILIKALRNPIKSDGTARIGKNEHDPPETPIAQT